MVSETSSKYRFAFNLLTFKHPHKAAIASGFIGPEAMRIAQTWVADLDVIEVSDHLVKKHGMDHFKPSKTDQLNALWTLSEQAPEAKDRIAAHRLYAEIAGNLAPKQMQVETHETKLITLTKVVPSSTKPKLYIDALTKELKREESTNRTLSLPSGGNNVYSLDTEKAS